METIDFHNKALIKSTLEKYENEIVDLNHEVMIVITPDGNVNRYDGDKNSVNSGDADLTGAYVTHNHPEGEGDFSFSDDDYNLFYDSGMEVLRGIDEKYVYEIKRNNGVAPELSELTARRLSHETYRHHIVAYEARKDGFHYERKTRSP